MKVLLFKLFKARLDNSPENIRWQGRGKRGEVRTLFTDWTEAINRKILMQCSITETAMLFYEVFIIWNILISHNSLCHPQLLLLHWPAITPCDFSFTCSALTCTFLLKACQKQGDPTPFPWGCVRLLIPRFTAHMHLVDPVGLGLKEQKS